LASLLKPHMSQTAAAAAAAHQSMCILAFLVGEAKLLYVLVVWFTLHCPLCMLFVCAFSVLRDWRQRCAKKCERLVPRPNDYCKACNLVL
jgi:hypothetical protein